MMGLNGLGRLLDRLNLAEEIVLTKMKWVMVPLERLSAEQQARIWDMYVATYKGIGLSVENYDMMKAKYKVSWLIDVDADPNPDAFILYLPTEFGKKITLMGSDGTKATKSLLIRQLIGLLRKPGCYCEASHKVGEIIRSNNVPIIDDEATVRKVLNKEITWVGDGKYRRMLSGVGMVEKTLYGSVML